MAKYQVFDYKQVAKYRVVQNKLSASQPYATQIIVTDGGPWAEHNVVCTVCGDANAILDLSKGIFMPCDGCTQRGWKLTRTKTRNFWWQFWRKRDWDA